MEISRRKFMTTTGAAIIVAGMKASGKVWGANDRVNMCTIGFNGQGRTHIGDLLEMKDKLNIQYTALCDVDDRVLRAGAKMVEKAQGTAPKTYVDMREVMKDPEVDAITIATPNHWHALAAIWGCENGKDVYVEKPAAHSIYEAKQVAAAAKKYNRIVQHGTQSRCNAELIRDMKLLQEGIIGKVVHSRGVVYKNGNRKSIGKGVPGEVPTSLNYELWQGPAPMSLIRFVKTATRRGCGCITTGTGSGSGATARLATRVCMRWTLPAGATTAGCPCAS